MAAAAAWGVLSDASLPVETLGPESKMDPECEGAAQAPRSHSMTDGEELAGTLDGEGIPLPIGSPPSGPTLPEKIEAKGTLEADDHSVEPSGPGEKVLQGEVQDGPVVTSLGRDTQDLEDQTPPQSLPSTSKTVWIREEGRCSSSEDDTDADIEGLRRRRGHRSSPPQTVASLDVEDQARDQGAGAELGISLNMCLLGALVLLGLGILLFSGPMEEAELQTFPNTGSETELDAVGDGQDRQREQLQASVLPDSVPNLQNMGLLLDRLAKENQDIRLLQAQLQAQKEELHSLMHQPKGLAEENARLRGALQQGQASQRALESEVQQLRARLQGLEADCVRGPDGVCLGWDRGPQSDKATKEQGHSGQQPEPGFLKQKEQLEAEAQALRRELQRQRQLLGSVQQNLQSSLRDAGRRDPAHAGLAELGHRLAQILQSLENWGQDPGVPGNASEAWYQAPRVQNAREWGGKEKWSAGQRDREAGHGTLRKEGPGWDKKSWEPENGQVAGGWREGRSRGDELGGRKDGKRQDPREHPRRSGHPHSGERQRHPPQGREGAQASEGSLPPWEELLRRKYQAPRGCSGVADCARQEGLALFGVELAPVQQQELASLLRTYLARLPWAEPLSKELPLSPAYFGEDGTFRHDRLRFRDFVGALEDSLEEAAERWTGDDDEVDDFEDFIFGHFFGDKVLRKRSGKKDKHLQRPRVMGPREKQSYHPHHYHRD
ncbi:pre-B-cell leukemia transcription factor-interacting protein 1 [Ctenodactylus gundi]